MAYFVAKELSMRPLDVLQGWCNEELLVAYGQYANANSSELYDSMDAKQRAKHKPKPLTYLDRWAVLFVTNDQLDSINQDIDTEKNELDIADISKIFM